MKSHCSKGHCDCFAAGKGCMERCQCINCENPLGLQKDAAAAVASGKKISERNGVVIIEITRRSPWSYVGTRAELPPDDPEDLPLIQVQTQSTKRKRSRGGQRSRAGGPGSGSGSGARSSFSSGTALASLKLAAARGEYEWRFGGHAFIGKPYLRVQESKAETGKVCAWAKAPKVKVEVEKGSSSISNRSVMFLVRFRNDEEEVCDELQTKRGMREATFKPGKRIKVDTKHRKQNTENQ